MNLSKKLASAAIIGILIVTFTSGCSSNNYGTNPGTTHHKFVSIYDNYFSPASVTVAVGDTITWQNKGNNVHTATSNDGTTFDSGDLAHNATYLKKFDAAGTIAYHCMHHGGMTASVKVQ